LKRKQNSAQQSAKPDLWKLALISGHHQWPQAGKPERYAQKRGMNMQGEISDWISLAALVTSFVAYLEAKKANKTSEAVEALQMVIDVSEETETYLQMRVNGGERDRQTEYRLAEHWSSASFMMSRVNKDLSVRLYDKSQFWRNPDTWDSKKIKEKNISLKSVSESARKLMISYA